MPGKAGFKRPYEARQHPGDEEIDESRGDKDLVRCVGAGDDCVRRAGQLHDRDGAC